jgi:histidine ammonia-lyase
METILIGPDHTLDIDTIHNVALSSEITVKLSADAETAVKKARSVVDRIIANREVVYGVTTGFGKFKDIYIEPEQSSELQTNLIRSHSVGVGPLLSDEVIRASLLLRINSLAKGYSGVRLEFLQTAVDILNSGIIPVVPSQGSVGASGDLAPLSHMGLTLMGEGESFYKGERMESKEALKRAGISPTQFTAKEGLAWNNGTAVMLGTLALALKRAKVLADLSDVSASLTLEAIRGTSAAFRPEVHELRPHLGQILSAKRIRDFIKDSKLVDAVPNRIQDAYSVRCTPQVHGASREAISYVENIVNSEIQSVTDNPIILPDSGEAISAGNFHGEPLAQAADTLSIALAELASISERRTAKLLDPSSNDGLPLFLIPAEGAGLNSGLMMPQYTAAALVSENKVLSHPASVDSIPTSANQEDHVSMGSIATRKALQITGNSENVLAIEFLTAIQAIDFRGPELLSPKLNEVYARIRSEVQELKEDRILSEDMNKVLSVIKSDSFLKLVI